MPSPESLARASDSCGHRRRTAPVAEGEGEGEAVVWVRAVPGAAREAAGAAEAVAV